ncbi:MAG: nicotinamidase [Anaerolineae bacterium]|nr:nicotinamidase [Anaerolineae bacterium]
MNFPSFYDPTKVGTLYVPDVAGAIRAGQAAGFGPADEDKKRVVLVLVDAQVDFIHADGALSVPGAVDDTHRTIEWLLSNTGQVTTIVASLDTHVPLQIFYPTWWVDVSGRHPEPFTPITAAEVERGAWMPVEEPEWSRQYVHRLEEQAKKTLMIWPYHTMVGTPGHAITPALYEAVAYHSAARATQPVFLVKGSISRTEHYSILEPEVKVKGEPLGDLNIPLLEMLSTYDLIYVAGQAKSHCVLETVTSLYHYFADHAPEKINRWRFLEDCTSSVAHPGIDFDALADEELEKYRQQGMQMVKSTDPVG